MWFASGQGETKVLGPIPNLVLFQGLKSFYCEESDNILGFEGHASSLLYILLLFPFFKTTL